MGNEKLALEKRPEADTEGKEITYRYPKQVFFIVLNEFCERFSYYGMRTILSLYLVDILLFSKGDAKIIYHTFTMLVYLFPVLGAMIADSWLGKFNTILYVSMIYALGNIVLAMSACPPLHFPSVPISMIGLLFIAMGSGGIKPCVAAFGGDQFKLPQQALQLTTFFSMFYFSINAGSLISTAVTPILREDVHCFGDESCFSLAFGVPGVLMIVSIIIFFIGKPLYSIKTPEGNMVIKVSRCISTAIKEKSKSTEKKEHWLDHAAQIHGQKLVEEVKALLKVLFLYIPLPVFWALFDQQGTGWTFQARIMDGNIGFYTILPDQMQVINPLLILIFIPIFQYGVYPLFNKLGILKTPLKRLVTGGLLAALAFGISACISLALEAQMPTQPHSGNGHLRIYNTRDCDLKLNIPYIQSDISINNMSYYENIDIEVDGEQKLFSYSGTCGTDPLNGIIHVNDSQALGYYFADNSDIFVDFEDSSQKDDASGYPKIRTLVNSNNKDPSDIVVKYINSNGNIQVETNGSDTEAYKIKPDEYTIEIDGDETKHNLRLGGVYVLFARNTGDNEYDFSLQEITEPNNIHMLLQIPQYVIITAGEIMYSITGLEFSYSQAPASMKSVLQACWLLTTAFGNLLVIIIELLQHFEEESSNFFLYTGVMVLDMIIFSFMAMRYKYVNPHKNDSEIEHANENGKSREADTDRSQENGKNTTNGIDNKAYEKDK